MSIQTFNLQKSQVFLREKYIPFEDANLSIASSPVLYGLSIYTVLAASWNDRTKSLHIFRLQDHYRRLLDSAKIMDFHNFADEWPYHRFEATIIKLFQQNNIGEDVLVRATVFIDELVAGTKIHDLKNSLSVYIYPLGEILPLKGIHACVSSWQRTPDNAIPSRAKINGSYVNASLMKNEALLNGYDEAIAIDEHGHVSEGTVANIFIVRDGRLITPDASTDILEGITRDSILQLAQKSGVVCIERCIDRSELYVADEAFMCGSSAKITPILSVDRRAIGDGKAGPLTAKLTKNYEALLRGESVNFPDWLTTISQA